MILKIFKAVWFLSVLAVVAVLLYAYASFPDTIQLTEAETLDEALTISRDGLFYTALVILGVLNALVFVVGRLMSSSDQLFHAWFYGLVVFFNLFGIVVLEFFNLYNSQERFDYSRIGFIIYGSVALIVLWASLWPLGRLVRGTRANPPVAEN
ncbi:MAG: hypothetical protein JNN04_16450 [Cyclobacteriaceae bacterium]|nr:hypothetical protein [Cyclobacteriaceae bacterium]MBL7866096.1 hypothetical protein [Cyclobacteriaceae bacterium]